MLESVTYCRKGDTTVCIARYSNGRAHAASAKHPDERQAQKLAYKALQEYIKVYELDRYRLEKDSVQEALQQMREGRFPRGVRVEVKRSSGETERFDVPLSERPTE